MLEAERGRVTSVSSIRHLIPVEEYLRLQGRYGHLFDADGKIAQPQVLERLQALADANIAAYGLLGDRP